MTSPPTIFPEKLDLRVGESSEPLYPELFPALRWLARLLRFRLSPFPSGPSAQSGRPSGQSAQSGPKKTKKKSDAPSLLLERSVDGVPSFMEPKAEEELRSLSEALGDSSAAEGSSFDKPPPIPEGGWLPSLAQTFGLNVIEALLVVAAIAPTVDGRFAQIFGRAQGVSRPERATVDLVARLLGFSLTDRLRMAGFLRPEGRLARFGLLRMDWSEAATFPPHLQPLDVSNRISWHLTEGSPYLPRVFRGLMSAVNCSRSLKEALVCGETRESLERFVELAKREREARRPLPILLLEGPAEAGQLEAASCVARELGEELLELNLCPLLSSGEPADLAVQLQREALLRESGVCLNLAHEDALSPTMQRRICHLADVEMSEFPGLIVLSGPWARLHLFKDLRRALFRVELRLPERELQRRVIEQTLEDEKRLLEPSALESLLNRYNLDHQTAGDLVRVAATLADSARPNAKHIQPKEVDSSVDMLLSQHLGKLSQRLAVRFNWEDLILPVDVKTQLQTLRHLVEHRYQVFEEWGVGRRMSSGRGIKALFSGPSGTGKTMAAEVIASDLRLPLYRVDLSAIVSKWVGETEKNLEQIFREAQSGQAILLFDEADALFGKRGEIDHANDRHANIEVSYLLQRFETHDGVALLTTNFPGAMDNAFSRRLHFVIEFPQPDEEMRRRLWRSMLVPPLPLADDLDVEFLAGRFEVAGANIKSAVMGSAFLAASEGTKVGMSQIIRAMTWEYQKLGRTVSSSDFGKYHGFLDD